MELRLYWDIIRRRLWLVLGLLALTGLAYLLYRPHVAPVYQAGMRFVVGIAPEPSTGEYYTYDRYYTWLTAEYLVDDLSEVVKSQAFARDVAAASGLDVPAGAIQGATSAGKLHRILNVTIQWGNPQELERIANAVPQVLNNQARTYFRQLGTENAAAALIDPPQVGVVGPSLRQRLDLPLRLILALLAGIGLCFLLDYLDDSIRHRADLETLGLRILGEIPRRRAWRWPWRRHRLP
jgi:capsular polysaccharide biosynthesis protein